jgi:hypothetical protein
VNPNLTLRLTAGNAIENVVGGSGNDSFTGNSLNNTFTGGSGNDSYFFNTSSPLGSDIIIDSGGTDTITFAGSTQDVVFNLGSYGARVVNSNLTLILASPTLIENLIGGNGDDTLIGNELPNSLTGAPGNDTLTGNGGSNSYFFNTSTQLGTDTITNNPLGSGSDTISFAGSSLGCTLDLSKAGVSQVVNANLTLILPTNRTIPNCDSGNGDDLLVGFQSQGTFRGNGGVDILINDGNIFGGGGGGVLVGAGKLVGGAGRSVLIGHGGHQPIPITGGGGGDILIAGITNYDSNVIALQAILAEWQRTDIGYSQRITDLRNGVVDGNGNTDQLVWGSTVRDDGLQHTLTGDPGAEPGGAELDWFFANLASGHVTITDLDPNETVN